MILDMIRKTFLLMAIATSVVGCADNTIPVANLPELDQSNPLLADWNTPHQTPPFEEIQLAHYEPAVDAAIACSRAEIDASVNNPSKPTFVTTIVALEKKGGSLDRVSGGFYPMTSAKTSDE